MAKKNSEKDTIFSQSTIYNSIDTFEYVPENEKTFEAFSRRYEDIINVDCTIKKTGNTRT